MLIFYLVFLYQHSSVITVCAFIFILYQVKVSMLIYTFIKKEGGQTVWKFFKNFNRITISLSNSEYISRKKRKKERKAGTKTDICTLMLIATIFITAKSWKSTDRWMDKPNVVYTYNEVLLSLKKEWNSGTCYSIHKP